MQYVGKVGGERMIGENIILKGIIIMIALLLIAMAFVIGHSINEVFDYDDLEKYEGVCESYGMVNKGNSDIYFPTCYEVKDGVLYKEYFIKDLGGKYYLEERK